MYIIVRVPQIDGYIRFLGAATRRAQREAQRLLRDDPAMVDGLRPDAIRDCRPGRRPIGWVE